ncbi:hypothetical protein [Azospirillum sp. TSO22-1]|uniref:hypothetical protein n=1 Tax=Azospirillum sp. TSO22-1 TaxID=716789 RepID=UPI000D606CDD|nr:hypothetical protein [Azospirillum sp. TSO22-1]PWC43115.1 hypothetical protein TSO221_20550 [Azospirillum sp. TSO22-1]
MPRNNRVTPFGAFIATPARGAFLGNRGCLTGRSDRIGARRWGVRAWICCRLDYPRATPLPLSGPGLYTQLFFLDEATAFAAGHRPCALCRRADFERFRRHWAHGNGLPAPPRAPELDARLHAERLAEHAAALDTLPDGAMVALPGAPDTAWLLHGGALHAWTPGGYGERRPRPSGTARLLTPPSAVAALADGYVPHTALPA